MQPDKMVRMANQIATFFQTQPSQDPASDDRAERVAAHINDFWEPRMRMQLLTHARAGGAGLSPLALDACAHVRRPAEA